jgi:hypothetical protein
MTIKRIYFFLMEPFNLIDSKKEEQNNYFFKNIQIRNQKEGKLILTKYDLENSIRDIVKKYEDNKEILLRELNTFFEKRQEFINFMVKYL